MGLQIPLKALLNFKEHSPPDLPSRFAAPKLTPASQILCGGQRPLKVQTTTAQNDRNQRFPIWNGRMLRPDVLVTLIGRATCFVADSRSLDSAALRSG